MPAATRAAATAAAIVAKDGLLVKTAPAAAGLVNDKFVAAVLSSSARTMESPVSELGGHYSFSNYRLDVLNINDISDKGEQRKKFMLICDE
jgi:hypothetical protein